MSRGTNKGIQSTRAPALRLAFVELSKAALFDLCVDLVRRVEGDETLDGELLLHALRDAYEPIRAMRRDLPLRVQARDRSTDADRTVICDVIDLFTRGEVWGRAVDVDVLVERLKGMRITRAQGESDLRALVEQERIERLIDRDGTAYRLTADEWRRRRRERSA